MWYLPRLPILLAYCRRLRAVGDMGCGRPAHRLVNCAWLRAVSLRSSARSSSRFISLSMSVPLPSNGFSPPAPSHRHAGRGDTMVPWRLSICLLAHRLAISSVRFGIGWRRDSVPASLDCPCLPPSLAHRHRRRLLTRSLVQSDFLAVLPSHRLISPITRHGERGGVLGFGCLPLLFDFTCDLFARVLCIAAAVVALLAWVSYYLFCRWGMW